MKFIVSTEFGDNFQNFVVKSSLKDIKTLIQQNNVVVDALVIHKPAEDDFNIGVIVADLYELGVKPIVYINSSPSVAVRMVIVGAGGFCYEDEFYFEDETELLELLNSLCNEPSENSLTRVSMSIVEDFMGAFARKESKVNSVCYMEQVTQAIDLLNKTVERQETQLLDMSSSVVAVYKRASTIVRKLAENQKQSSAAMSKLLPNAQQAQPMSNMITSFPQFTYMGNSSMLVVREVCPCRYLTSFLLAYHHHLKYDMNKRVKLIFLHPKAYCVARLYEGVATALTVEGQSSKSLYDAEVVATSIPTKAVMQRLTGGHEDVIVVVDRMYQKPTMVTGRVKSTVYAAAGAGDLRKYKVDVKDSILSVVAHPQGLITLPTIMNFPLEADLRMSQLIQANVANFAKLDKRLDLQ